MHSLLRLSTLAIALAACQTGIQGHHEINSGAPFDRYTSFAWISADPLIRPAIGVASGQNVRISPIMEQTIREAVDWRFLQKGYEKRLEPASADLIVSFSVGAREKIQVTSSPARAGYRYGGYAGGYGGYGGGWQSDVRTYSEGTLSIDVFDGKARQAVWHGWATKRLGRTTDQEKRTALIKEAVDAILESFPVRNTLQ